AGSLPEVGEQAAPAAQVALAPGGAVAAEALPAAVDDGDGCGGTRAEEGDLALGRPGAVGPQVPEVGQAARWLPGQDLAPVVLDPVGGPLEDPAARTGLERHHQPGRRRPGVGG